ncbi:vWA domain-containing protein [Chungangia koreensis]|uniref:VWA domain-containing protein n=1 Tax=Chungangia koreensis TaxID=752657 RepID=A0ABV8X6V0_9LACT
MTSFNRFIKFNNEQVDAKKLLSYELLARALSSATYLKVTQRKLMEFRPSEGAISFSFFWKHRSEEIERAGQKTDIYLLAAGFWRDFDIASYQRLLQTVVLHPLRNLAIQIGVLFEEFRLMEQVIKERPGTSELFTIRTDVMVHHHREQFFENSRKGFVADALLNYIYISVHKGTMFSSSLEGPDFFSILVKPIERIYDQRDTKSNMSLATLIAELAEEWIERDLVHTYYSLGDELSKDESFHYHAGVKDADIGDEEQKDTIEEIFRTWHRENQTEKGVHLNFELENGQSGRGGTDARQGHEDTDITEIGLGRSEGKQKPKRGIPEREGDRVDFSKKDGSIFGENHAYVVYEEKRIDYTKDEQKAGLLEKWRLAQEPHVRAFVKELRRRIDLKRGSRRDHLSIGRLSSNILPLVTEERPRPFYRKQAPSKNLDAVFGLLVDGSASMTDKLEETKMAVLLFHDILRRLEIRHEIVLFYEDAFEATATMQPNTFEWVHKLEDGVKDSGHAILSVNAHEDNRDGFAIRWMVERLKNQQEKHKFLLVFSDGEPSAFGYDQNGILDTAEAVIQAEKAGISVLHLFLNTVAPSEEQKELFRMIYGAKSAASDTVEDFSDQTLRILRKMLTLVVQSH